MFRKQKRERQKKKKSTRKFYSFLGLLFFFVKFANSPEDRGSIPGRIIPKTQKMVLALLNIQHYMVWIKGKVD